MQFGIFSVGDVTPDPLTGRVPAEHERIKAMVTIARQAEEAGLDVFATGEHHNPPFVPSGQVFMRKNSQDAVAEFRPYFDNHARLPLKTVLEQIDMLGEEVVPVLRRELDAKRPAHVPDAPTHASLLAAARAGAGQTGADRAESAVAR